MPRICFVTNELHPVAPGGIGRLMYNFAQENRAGNHGAELHYLFPQTATSQQALIEESLRGLGHVHFCGAGDPPADLFEQGLALPPPDEQPFEQPYLHSVRYMRALAQLRRKTGFDFDVIEFPDYGGWAFATLAAKASGFDFARSCIAVRLHSSFGLISHAERFYHQSSAGLGAMCDMERYCLEKADLVAAHLDVIATINATHYGLGAAWRARVRIAFPPILPDDAPPAALPPDLPADLPWAEEAPLFVFSSRLQPFKRPDRFIRAGARFLRRNPGSKAYFLLVSYGHDEAYIDWLRDMIPAAWRTRILLLQGFSAAARRAVLNRGIIVVPSDYESLCLFAYEWAQLGRCVILNRDCAAFGACDRWRDGENCLMFDGDYIGLAEVMENALHFTPVSVVSAEPDRPYWLDELPSPEPAEPPGSNQSRVRLLMAFEGDPAAFPELCFRLSRMNLEDVAVTIALPEAPWREASRAAALVRHFGWDFIFQDGETPHAAELNHWVAGFEEEFVIILRQPYSLEPGFVGTGLRAMRQNPALAIFATHVARLYQGRVMNLEFFAGPLPSVALAHSAVCPPACMIRRSALLAWPFDPHARFLWLEVFSRETVFGGGDVLIAPAALVTCERRDGASRSNALIDGTLRDDLGLAAGLRPRLLALEAPPGAGLWKDNPAQSLAGRALSGIRRSWPPSLSLDYEPVCYQGDFNNVLVHPLPDTIVLGHLGLTLARKPRRLECVMRNAHAGNMGFEAMAGLLPEPLCDDALASLAADGPIGPEWTGWVFVPPDTKCILTLQASRRQGAACNFYIGTRLREGAHNAFAWAHLDSITIY